MNNCKYGNEKCLCQFCKSKCDKVSTCLDCLSNGKAVHEISMCTKYQRYYERNFMVFTDEEIDKLKDGRPVYYYDGNRYQTVFFSEEGYKEFKKFWNEDEQEEQ